MLVLWKKSAPCVGSGGGFTSNSAAMICADRQLFWSRGRSLFPSHHQENWHGGCSPPWRIISHGVAAKCRLRTRLSTVHPTAIIPCRPSPLASQYIFSARHCCSSLREAAFALATPHEATTNTDRVNSSAPIAVFPFGRGEFRSIGCILAVQMAESSRSSASYSRHEYGLNHCESLGRQSTQRVMSSAEPSVRASRITYHLL